MLMAFLFVSECCPGNHKHGVSGETFRNAMMLYRYTLTTAFAPRLVKTCSKTHVGSWYSSTAVHIPDVRLNIFRHRQYSQNEGRGIASEGAGQCQLSKTPYHPIKGSALGKSQQPPLTGAAWHSDSFPRPTLARTCKIKQRA